MSLTDTSTIAPKTIYLFSGLGADARVFEKLNFHDCPCVHIQWITPLKNETISAYAKRLLAQITTENPILIGLSFGGMMAVEVAQLIAYEKLILLASAKTKFELPFYLRFLGYLRVHKIIPTALMKNANMLSFWLFGVATAEDKKLLTQIFADMNSEFLRWALHQIATWQNEIVPKKLTHIHGTSDKILPLYFVKADIVVEKGGHFMTFTMAEQVSAILNKTIASRLVENQYKST